MYSFLKAFLVLMKLLSLSQFYASKFLYFNDFLFVVFAGKKQREQVGKCQKFEKKSS